MAYELFYWDGMPGRGEFVRLALEDAGATYVDVVREAGRGVPAMMALLGGGAGAQTPFAPPFLKDGDLIVSHVANILFYLGPKLGLAPQDEGQRFVANALQLTIADLVAEVHDTHHPISGALYYEDQQEPAKARAAAFLSHRLPKFLGYFERVLQANETGSFWILGASASYVDLSLFQLIEGLNYAFPRAMTGYAARYPSLAALHGAVRERPNIARYLASERRLVFTEEGLFRHYPALDQDPA